MKNCCYHATSCEFRLVEDDWNEGESLDPVSVWNEDVNLKKGRAESVKQLLANVPYLWCNAGTSDPSKLFINDPCDEGDFSRFDADLLVTLRGSAIDKPAAEQLEAWKKGECKMHALHITLYVRKLIGLDASDVEGVCRGE